MASSANNYEDASHNSNILSLSLKKENISSYGDIFSNLSEEYSINDFSFICVFLKTFTTFLYTKYLTGDLEEKFNLFDNINSIDEIYYWIKLFYKLECLYLKWIYTIVGIILFSLIKSVLKEIFRGKKYVL